MAQAQRPRAGAPDGDDRPGLLERDEHRRRADPALRRPRVPRLRGATCGARSTSGSTFPVDMVVEPFVRVPKAIRNTGFGVHVEQEIARRRIPPTTSWGTSTRTSSRPRADLEKIRMPADQPRRRPRPSAGWRWPTSSSTACWRCGRGARIRTCRCGTRSARGWASRTRCTPWSTGPTSCTRLVGRMTDGYLSMLDQLEEQGLLCGPQSLIHCTGAYTDELPAPGYDPQRPRAEGPLDVRPGADVLHRLARDVQGIRGGLRQPHLRRASAWSTTAAATRWTARWPRCA